MFGMGTGVTWPSAQIGKSVIFAPPVILGQSCSFGRFVHYQGGLRAFLCGPGGGVNRLFCGQGIRALPALDPEDERQADTKGCNTRNVIWPAVGEGTAQWLWCLEAGP